MIAARDFNYFYNPDDFIETDDTELLPTDPVGQDFFRILNPKGWDFIYAKIPKYKPKGSWYFESQYPMEPRIFWNKYTNPNELVGTSFRKETTYFVLDIDWHSQYHPSNDEYALREILGRMEDIGLCRSVIIQSSESGGLHVYFFLPYPIHSYTLAAAIAEYLSNAGFTLEDGQLELYPNPKRWSETPTCFKPLRSPLQAGSFVLDGDYQLLHNDIGLFLEEAELTRTLQDIDTLIEALSLAPDWSARQFKGDRKMSGTHFRQDLEAIMSEGWTGDAQSNHLFKKIATYGVIFQHLSGQDLVNYIERKAQSLPGYDKFCGHKHEIHQRAKHVAKWAQSFSYTPYPELPVRDKTYEEHNRVFFGRGSSNTSANASNANNGSTNIDNVIPLSKNRQHEQTMEKLITAIQLLQEQGAYPEATTARGKAIIAKSIEIYNEGISPNTLRKEDYRKYWHPLYIVLESENAAVVGQAGVTACPEQVTAFRLPDVWQELEDNEWLEPGLGEYLSVWERYWWDRECKLSSSKDSRDLGEELHRNSIYEGQLLLAPSQSASEVSNISNRQGLEFETKPQAQGELELEIPLTTGNATNQMGARINLVLTISILFQIVNSFINSITQYLNSLPKEFKVNSHELISQSLNNLISQLVDFNEFNSFNVSNCSNSVIEVNSVIEINARICTIYDSTLFWHLLSRHVLVQPNLLIQTQKINIFLSSLSEPADSNSTSKCNSTSSPRSNGADEASGNKGKNNLKQPALSGASNPSRQEVDDASQAHKHASTTKNVNPLEADVLPVQWQEQREKMQQEAKARQLLKNYCEQLNQKPNLGQQQYLKNILHYGLLLKSSFQSLEQEARLWFADSSEVINQVTGFDTFWAYMDSLSLEIPF